MINDEKEAVDFTRRDFLKEGSLATLLTMMGGVRLFAQTNAAASVEKEPAGPKIKVAVIGLGAWGREIVSTLALIPQAEIAAVCDTYPAFLRRGAANAPGAAQVADYKTILDNKDIHAVVIATPTHQHKEVVLAAIKAGKHVYCEAPLAHTIEEAREIAAAAKANRQLIFQSGLQDHSDPQRNLLLKTFRSGGLGEPVMARAQWHKKTNWRTPSSNPQREKELNWRLYKATSPGLLGEIGVHPIDQAIWYLNKRPTAVTGFGSIMFWKDDREVPDTVQTVLEFPGGLNLMYDATLANSFDSEYEMYYGSDSAVMLRQSDVWLFKEVDAGLLGWEVYYPKETFGKETGIVLKMGGSKSTSAKALPANVAQLTESPLSYALKTFVRNSDDFINAREEFVNSIGDDPEALAEHLATKVLRRPAAGYQEGLEATVTALKANEAVLTRQRIVLKPEWYELS